MFYDVWLTNIKFFIMLTHMTIVDIFLKLFVEWPNYFMNSMSSQKPNADDKVENGKSVT